jgi:DNA-binding NtrC family response regulator
MRSRLTKRSLMATILILDDVLDSVVLLQRILDKKGHQVVGYTEEELAIAHVRNHRVDLAILDIKLKKMEGVEVLAEMKKLDPHIRAIMLTGYPTLETARESLRLGALEYCVKPIDKDEIEEKVAKVLEQKVG